MMTSEQINELAEALSKAQAQMKPVIKAGVNPHLGNKYITLDSIIETARKPLTDNGLSFSQLLQQGVDGLMLETVLMHSSGQYLSSEFVVIRMEGNRGVNEMQALGSTLTYLKRYALAAMLGISADEDDDGTASKSAPPKKQTKPQPKKDNGNGKHPDAMTQYWLMVKEYALTKEQGQEILANNGNDAVKALDALEGVKQD